MAIVSGLIPSQRQAVSDAGHTLSTQFEHRQIHPMLVCARKPAAPLLSCPAVCTAICPTLHTAAGAEWHQIIVLHLCRLANQALESQGARSQKEQLAHWQQNRRTLVRCSLTLCHALLVLGHQLNAAGS